ncbi:MAG: ABC transporter ATP-binding protein [Anaerolineae bacterium]|jgi:ATP-binding cassette subfamily B protein
MSLSEFAVPQSWQSDRRGTGRWVVSHISRNWVFFLGILLGAFGNALLAAAQPVLVGRAFDAIAAPSPNLNALATAAGLIVATQLVRGVLMLARNFSSEVIGQRLERGIREELYISLLGKSMSFHDMRPTGEVMARATNDVREVNLMANPGMNLVIGSANFLIMPLIVGPTLHPQLILAPLVYLVSYAISVSYYIHQLRPATARVRQQFGEMNAALAEAIDGIETVKGSAQEPYEASYFARMVTSWRDAFVAQGDIEARYYPLLLMGLVQGFGLLHSLLLFRAGEITVGQVIAYNGLLMLFGFPTFVAQFAYSQVASGLSSARRILELINAKTELDQNVAGEDQVMRGEVVFDDVCFDYGGDQDDGQQNRCAVLQHVSFRVDPGKTVAIVGQTGSGKSTVTKLINRIYDTSAGRVLIDGIDVRDWNMGALRRQISIIEQDIFLFSRSVADNIGYGRPGATREEIVAAARAAQAHEFILSFQDGFDTVIGERGVTLSGGQRQRLALARAFLTDPRILILDDSTSAIDSATEDRIQQAIERAAADRTTFLITHRLSQIRWADLIIVMRQGEVAASGTHEELMASSVAYRNIFSRYG